MGWSAGSELAIDVYDLVKEYIPKHKRKEIATKIFRKFEDLDAEIYD